MLLYPPCALLSLRLFIGLFEQSATMLSFSITHKGSNLTVSLTIKHSAISSVTLCRITHLMSRGRLWYIYVSLHVSLVCVLTCIIVGEVLNAEVGQAAADTVSDPRRRLRKTHTLKLSKIRQMRFYNGCEMYNRCI